MLVLIYCRVTVRQDVFFPLLFHIHAVDIPKTLLYDKTMNVITGSKFKIISTMTNDQHCIWIQFSLKELVCGGKKAYMWAGSQPYKWVGWLKWIVQYIILYIQQLTSTINLFAHWSSYYFSFNAHHHWSITFFKGKKWNHSLQDNVEKYFTECHKEYITKKHLVQVAFQYVFAKFINYHWKTFLLGTLGTDLSNMLPKRRHFCKLR